MIKTNEKIEDVLCNYIEEKICVISFKEQVQNATNIIYVNANKRVNYVKIFKDSNITNIVFDIDAETGFSTKLVEKIVKICRKMNIVIGTNDGFIANINTGKSDENLQNNAIQFFTVIGIKDRKEQCEYIYDIVCDYLDNEFIKNNYCDFQGDTCIANRVHGTVHKEMGCCYNFKMNKITLSVTDVKICRNMSDRKCHIKCLPCKLFVCGYLRKKGIHFRAKDIFLLEEFFNKKQLKILTENIFVPRDEIIQMLLKCD